MRHLFYCDTTGWLGSVGLLVLRLVMGAAFMFHGWPKIQNPLGWMGPDAPVPAILQALAALAEFGGGMALIVGLLTRLACLGIATNMIVALGMVHLPHGETNQWAKASSRNWWTGVVVSSARQRGSTCSSTHRAFKASALSNCGKGRRCPTPKGRFAEARLRETRLPRMSSRCSQGGTSSSGLVP